MPNIKLTSYGASQEVTGSCHLLNIDGFRILIDCGLFQGGPENYHKNWDELLFSAKDIDVVILTHAHLDHCGRLPVLYRHGYKGKIYATGPTIKLAKIVLEDNLQIMTEKSVKQNLIPLYSSSDLMKTNISWIKADYYQKVELGQGISFTFNNAGHILGSATAKIEAGGKSIVFSGDIGGHNMPLVKDIDYIDKADWVVCESTYGDRVHEDVTDRDKKLIDAVKRVTLNNSTLLITIFAIERTQDILKVLNDYYETHLDFKVPVYLDSPMAAEATKIYKEEIKYLNDDAQATLQRDNDIFRFPHLTITNHSRESKKINSVPPPKIILAGSGMVEGGRMLHHFGRYLSDRNNHVLFMGYQVPGTLGSKVLSGAFDFDYYGRKVPVKAGVDQIDGFSAHADKNALLDWLGHFQNPKKILLSHGDDKVLDKFSQSIKEKLGYESQVIEFNTPIVLS